MRKYFIFLILLFFLALTAFYYWQGIYLPKDANSQIEKLFIIAKGEGTREIAFNLEKEGLIKWAPLFRLYTLFKGVSGKLQAGEYLLSPSMTVPEIIEKFLKGEVITLKVTIPEGFTIDQIEEKLNEKLQFKIRNFTVSNFKQDFGFLTDAPDNTSLEGFLFPDTYQFSYGVSEEEILRKMLANFDEKLTPQLREEIKTQGKSIFEIVTMASLIEKEVRTIADKKLVSGILWKRRDHGMLLQVDATIIYILGERTTDPEGVASRPYGARISVEETKIDSPYNTYKYKGLPLGPISNPGLESIIAAVYPESSEYWYYLSTPEGETIFSKTFEEHNIAKAKYLE